MDDLLHLLVPLLAEVNVILGCLPTLLLETVQDVQCIANGGNVKYTVSHLRGADLTGVRPIQVISNSVAYGFRSLILKVESKEEILADKIVALGARDYLKSRDLWDIHMLTQDRVVLNTDFVRSKINDYHLDYAKFLQQLLERTTLLSQPSTVSAFQKELTRFLDAQLQAFIHDPKVVRQILDVVIGVTEGGLDQLTLNQALSPEEPRMRFRI